MEKTRSDYRPEDILLGVRAETMRMWVVFDDRIFGVVVTEIHRYPVRKVCLVVLVAGERFREWGHLLDSVLMPWARAEGCSVIRGYCRKGWRRILDWKMTKVVLERAL